MAQALRRSDTAVSAAETAPRPRTSWRDDLVTAGLSGWVMVGVGADAWAHTNQKPDTFFTPWHGLLYSGSLALIAWLVWTARRALGWGTLRSGTGVPVGYRLGLIGGVVFLASGIADGFWHTLFGIEVNLEAVLSPSHIGLLLGLLLLFSTPFRAAWASRQPGTEPTLREFLPGLLSLTLTMALVTLFLASSSAFVGPVPILGLPTGPPRGSLAEYANVDGFMSVLFTNLLLMGPLLLVLRRWRPPPGTATILFPSVVVVHFALDNFQLWWLLLAAVAGGLAADWCMARARRGAGLSRVHLLTATVTPLVLWSSYFLLLEVQRGVTWSAELWTGSIIFACLGGLALHLLMLPPRPPELPSS